VQKIEVRKISEGEAREVFKRLVSDHSDEFLRRLFKDAFQCELNRIVLPENERSYYLVAVGGRDEALFGISENGNQPRIWNISSFGRIIQKDKTEGWQYLEAILDSAISRGVNIINAVVNDAGEKAFKQLERNRGLPKNWKIEYFPCGSLTNVGLSVD